ncbi:MAG: InlB B-repeat-containing protein [Firmicutes bacterium]|nr:InlB B-repeat-containing protein [Bacillota bacterium]
MTIVKKNYRNEITFFVLMTLICFMFFCFGKKKVWAENVPITVSNFEELRAALCNANQDTEIIVSQIITLPSDIELDGHGATVRVEKPYINADGKVGSGYSNYGVFIIDGNVDIKNMKIMGGSNHEEDMDSIDPNFAALQIQSGTVEMRNVVITRSGRGISIQSRACVTLSDSQIVRNSYSHGGGIYCTGKLIMNNCSCSENRTTFSDGGGGAMEINAGGELYANNTIIANNASREIGGAIGCVNNSKIYLINCTISGNVTTAQVNYGGGICLNSTSNQFYAANCIFVNNYYLDQTNNQLHASDIGTLSDGNVLHLYNCLYNSIVKSYSSDDSQNVKIVDCKTGTEDQNVAKTYRNDGIFLSKDEISQGFLHPAAVAKLGTSGVGLYIPIQEEGLAATGGTNTYFDFSDLNNIKMGYGSDENITALGNLAAPAATAKISNYYEDGSREAGIIGASGIDEDDYYTVKLADYEHGTVEGATFYGDTYKRETSVTVKAIENVNGYVFKKWTLVSDAGVEKIITNNPYTFEIIDNITLLPEFVEGYRYYVVFDGNGETSGEMDEVSFISDLGIDQYLPENVFTRKGYEFIRWNTESDGSGTKYENQAKITNLSDTADATITLYAQWEPIKYNVVFNSNGGSGTMANQEFTFDAAQALTENNFTREGYTFNGWKDNNGTSYADKEQVTNLSDTADATITLYAQWEPVKYNVEFNSNGGSGTMTNQEFTFDVEQALTENSFTREGYTFNGWNTESDGSGTSYTDQARVTNLADTADVTVTLYAQWEKNKTENDENTEFNYSWSTVENSGGSSSASTNQDLISKNESTDTKTQALTKSKIPEKLQMRRYLKGYDDEKIKPENYVTNAEFATIIYRLMNDGEQINYDKLKDLGVEKSDWFAEAVAYLIDDSRKIIQVTDEKFNPNKNITGYEMLNIIHNVLKFYGVESNSLYAQNLNSEITRAKMSEIIFKAFERKSNPGQKIYSDLDKNHWAYKYLMDASE